MDLGPLNMAQVVGLLVIAAVVSAAAWEIVRAMR
jgi:hypothetical protein